MPAEVHIGILVITTPASPPARPAATVSVVRLICAVWMAARVRDMWARAPRRGRGVESSPGHDCTSTRGFRLRGTRSLRGPSTGSAGAAPEAVGAVHGTVAARQERHLGDASAA